MSGCSRHQNCVVHLSRLSWSSKSSRTNKSPEYERGVRSSHFTTGITSPTSAVVWREHKTDTGHMKVSSPELTALDLLRYAPALGGLDNVVTVLGDLAYGLDAEQLAALSGTVERSVVRRLGYLLESLGYADRVGLMNTALGEAQGGWVELDPTEARDPLFAPSPVARNPKWRVVVRRVPEVDR